MKVKNMLVYRIEHHETGLGPWMQSVKDHVYYQDAFSYINEPDDMDSSVCIPGKFFGVADKMFFILKITNFRFLRNVFNLTTYEVEDGHYHQYEDGQVLFDKKYATKIESIPVIDFLRNEQ